LWALIAYNFVDIDIWHQMALIRESLVAGHLLKIDPYAYTPTLRPWIDHEWGAGAVAYFATTRFGGRAVLVLKLLVAAGSFAVCFRCARRRGSDYRLLTLCAPLSIYLAYLGFFATIRAQAYSFFLAALLLWMLEMDREGSRRWIVLWLVLFPLWVNLHAGFVVGIGLVGLHACEQAFRRQPWRHLLLPLAIMSFAILLNPYGTAYFGYLRRALFMSRPYAPEWGPAFTLGNVWTVVLAVAVVSVVYAVCALTWTRVPGILILLATAVEGLLHRKMLPFFAIAWLCYVPSFLQQTKPGNWWRAFAAKRERFLTAAWAVFASVCVVAAVRQNPWELAAPQPIYPVGPVRYLAQQKFSGNLLTPFRLGAYVSWRLYPAVRISLDSRYEVAYPEAVVKQIFDFYEAQPDWQAALIAFPTDAALIPRDTPAAVKMETTGWQRVYTDRQFEIFVRPGLQLGVQDWSAQSFSDVFP
jgi:hypothetical protein